MIFLTNIKQTCVFLVAQKNRLNEMILFCTHNIFFFLTNIKHVSWVLERTVL